MATIQSCSPDRDHLRDALRSGGDANLNVNSGKQSSLPLSATSLMDVFVVYL